MAATKMLELFRLNCLAVPSTWIDVETTGVRPGKDRAVSVAIVRFEGGAPVGEFVSLVNPGMAIPVEATAIHGITDEQVATAPTIADVFALPDVTALLTDAQPGAYNASFDRHFVPPFGDDWTWPFLDALSLVRVVDMYERGKGRHRLGVACARHGIDIGNAHSALDDARAAGRLFYQLVPKCNGRDGNQPLHKYDLGMLLKWQRMQEAEEWHRFNYWLARQPPRESSNAVG